MIIPLLFISYVLGALVAMWLTLKEFEQNEPMASSEDMDYAKNLCFLSWVWVIYLLTEK